MDLDVTPADSLAGWWPVDYLIVGYLALTAALLAAFHAGVADPWRLIGAHALAIALLVAAIYTPGKPAWIFRHWYPLPYVASCYKEMPVLILAAHRPDRDAWLAQLDYRIWGVHPTVWLERVQTPVLTEILQLLYALFVPSVLLVAVLLWQRKRFEQFRHYAFLISLGFLVSYLGYFLVPARGPRYLLAGLQTKPLQGLWTYQWFRHTLDHLESAAWDCFPSGHTELTILAWWSSRKLSNRLYNAYFVYTCCIVFATVYLRYHYTVDVLAGALVAYLLIALAPSVYEFHLRGRVIGRR